MARRPETPAALLMASLPTEEQGARPGRDLASAAADHSPARAESSRAGAGDPLKIAEALVSVEQDAASDQMKGELLRLAREVARVGGEAAPGDSSELLPGRVAPGDVIRPPSPNPAGT